MTIAKRVVQRVVKQNSAQQVNNRVVYPGDSGSAFENGIHLDFANSVFYTKAAGQDANVKSRIQDLFTFTGGNQSMYRGANGLLKQSVTNTPRIEYDSTGACLGLLMEASRTNLCLQSQTFDDAAWTYPNASASANTTTSPDGTSNADSWIENTATATHRLRFTTELAITAATTYTASIFMKYNGRAIIGFKLCEPTEVNGATASFNIQTGVISTAAANSGAGTGATATITPYGNGWYRCTVSCAINAAAVSGGMRLSLNDTATYLGDGVSGAFVYGAQFEAGAFASSYIPTTTVSVARTADSCIRTLSTEFSATAGTVVVAGRASGGQDAVNGQHVWEFNNGTSSNRLRFVRVFASDTARVQVTDATVTQALLDATFTNLTNYKSAAAWAANDFAHSFNGAAVLTDAAGTIPALTSLNIGYSAVGADIANGHIRTFDYWPVRYSDTFLEAASGDGYEQGVHLDFTTDTYWVKSATTNIRTNGASLTDLFTFVGGSESMYVGPTGLLVQSVTNTPRIEYDPVTLVKRGLLMEATRTNLTLQSQNFATSWTTGSSSISTNLIAAPDGTTTADKLVSSSGSAAMFVGQAFTLSATTVYNFSVFAKYISGEARYVAFRPDVDSAPIVSFDLVNNVVVTTTAPWSNAVMTQYANGWYRLSANYTTVGTAYTFRISIDNTGTAGSFTGNGSKGVYLWGSQLELGLFPTSYIPTTTASVARTQDACSRALGTEFSATAGTFVVQGRAGGGQAVGARQVFCAVTDGTVSNTIPILRPGSSDGCQLRIEAGGVNQTAIGATFTNLTSFKTAGAWVVNSVQMAFNGVLLTEDTVATIPTVTTMHIGNEIGGNVCNGHIARFDYTPGRKSNGRLAALSA